MSVRLKRAEKYGFCAGVRIADRKVRQLAQQGHTGKILGQVVHNERVVDELTQLGVGTTDSLDAVSSGTIVFSAHGVPPSFHRRARERGLSILDTTCPFVYDVHEAARQARAHGYHLVFIGDPRHREMIGYTHDLSPSDYHVVSTLEQVRDTDWSSFERIKVFYQTTLNSEEYEGVVRLLEERCREVERSDTICYATKENQDAARLLASDPETDRIVVIGGRHSANTRHLWEICRELKPSRLVHGVEDLDAGWLAGARTIGITAGASTPDSMIEDVERAIEQMVATSPEAAVR